MRHFGLHEKRSASTRSTYQAAEKAKSHLYVAVLPMLNSRRDAHRELARGAHEARGAVVPPPPHAPGGPHRRPFRPRNWLMK
jgi:hypothetical protein